MVEYSLGFCDDKIFSNANVDIKTLACDIKSAFKGCVLECKGGFISQPLLCNPLQTQWFKTTAVWAGFSLTVLMLVLAGLIHTSALSCWTARQAVLLLGWLVFNWDDGGTWATCLSSSTRLAQACSNGDLRLPRTARGQAPFMKAFQSCLCHIATYPTGQSKLHPRVKQWRNRVYLFMGGAAKSHCKGLEVGRRRICGHFVYNNGLQLGFRNGQKSECCQICLCHCLAFLLSVCHSSLSLDQLLVLLWSLWVKKKKKKDC